jgi:hypothetical protein
MYVIFGSSDEVVSAMELVVVAAKPKRCQNPVLEGAMELVIVADETKRSRNGLIASEGAAVACAVAVAFDSDTAFDSDPAFDSDSAFASSSAFESDSAFASSSAPEADAPLLPVAATRPMGFQKWCFFPQCHGLASRPLPNKPNGSTTAHGHPTPGRGPGSAGPLPKISELPAESVGIGASTGRSFGSQTPLGGGRTKGGTMMPPELSFEVALAGTGMVEKAVGMATLVMVSVWSADSVLDPEWWWKCGSENLWRRLELVEVSLAGTTEKLKPDEVFLTGTMEKEKPELTVVFTMGTMEKGSFLLVVVSDSS